MVFLGMSSVSLDIAAFLLSFASLLTGAILFIALFAVFLADIAL